MRWLPLVLSLLATPAAAADFRVLNFGGSCAAAPELEKALGSVQIPSQSGPNQQTFKGRVFDREATIMYLCQEGKLVLGNYLFPKQAFEAALEGLHHVYDGLTSTFGVPYIDSSPWQYGSAISDPRVVASDPSMFMAAWRDARVHVNTAIHSASRDKTGVDWAVLVVFSRPGL
jgi:hypothetical protein